MGRKSRHNSNPHLIYPGQQVKLPGGVLVATGDESLPIIPGDEMGMGEAEIEKEDEFVDDSGFDFGELADESPKPFSVTTETAIIASGYITKDPIKKPVIIGADTESFDLSTTDTIYIDAGTMNGIEPDQDYFIIRKIHKVVHPLSQRYLGWMIHVVGECKTLCVDEDSSAAILGECYEAVLRGDVVVPKEEVPIPVTLGSPPTDVCNPSTKQLPGTIIDAFYGGPKFSDAVILGRGDIGYIDLGNKDGVAPGDYFTVFKRNLQDPRLPRYVAGEAMVVKVSETTSTIVVTRSRTAIFLGDQIELKQ